MKFCKTPELDKMEKSVSKPFAMGFIPSCGTHKKIPLFQTSAVQTGNPLKTERFCPKIK